MIENSTRAIAKEFAVYRKLDGIDRWKLRRLLKWVRPDPVSLGHLLDFERKLAERDLFSWQVLEILSGALAWCSDEVSEDHPEERVPPSRLPAMLEIAVIFLGERHKLHSAYWDLFEQIVCASDNLGEPGKSRPGITPEQFRLEAAKHIATGGPRRRDWEDWHPAQNNAAKHALIHLEDLAHRVQDLQQFRMVCREIAPAIGWEGTSSLIAICPDLQQSSAVCQEIVPAIGREATCSLIAISSDFQELSGFFARISEQLKRWRWTYSQVFGQIQNASELDQVLCFLETLLEDPLIVKCIRYTESHHPGVWRMPSNEVREACLETEWLSVVDYDAIVNRMAEKFVQNIVADELRTMWRGIGHGKVRWPFYQFTDYVPYAARNNDWTADDDRTRRYWNWREGERQEFRRFETALRPRLRSIFRESDLDGFELVVRLLPDHLEVEEFRQEVRVPVVWERGVESREVYERWIGPYTEKVEVARPKGFGLHTFTFERPSIQGAINLLDDDARLRELVQAHRNTRG